MELWENKRDAAGEKQGLDHEGLIKVKDLGEMEITKGEKENATTVNNNKKGCKILIQDFGT